MLNEDFAEEKHQVREISKELKRLQRVRMARRRNRLERELRLASRRGRKAEVQRLIHLLAARSRGTRKRLFRNLATWRPARAEVERHVVKTGGEGGLNGVIVNAAEEVAKHLEEQMQYEIEPMDMNFVEQAKEDMRTMTWKMKVASKRRMCPPWSAPTELFLQVLEPSYCSVKEQPRSGIGIADIKEWKHNYSAASDEAHNLLIHVRRVGILPASANYSFAAMLDKMNGKKEMDGQIIIHLLCHFWKAFCSGLLACGLKQAEEEARSRGERLFQDYCHGFVGGRRREEAMMTQRQVGWKLDKAGVDHINELMDMSNAFCCTDRRAMCNSIDVLFRERDRLLMKERTSNSVVYIWVAGEDDPVTCVPQHGGLMGTSEAPTLFNKSFEQAVEAWRHTPGITDERMLWQSPLAENAVDVSISAFADDLFKKHLLEEGTAQEASTILSNSAFVLNSELTKIRMVQNESKREIVPRLSATQEN